MYNLFNRYPVYGEIFANLVSETTKWWNQKWVQSAGSLGVSDLEYIDANDASNITVNLKLESIELIDFVFCFIQ